MKYLKKSIFFLGNALLKRINYVYVCDEHKEKTPYQPGLERWSMYKTLWTRHWSDFQKIYPWFITQD